MAKTSTKQRNAHRQEKVARYKSKSAALRAKQQDLRRRMAQGEQVSYDDIMAVQFERQKKLPRNASASRVRNRCTLSGRPRGVYRRFGLCRNFLRDYGNKGLIPGLRKASW